MADHTELEEYSETSTTISFDHPLPLLRRPVAGGEYVLAFRDGASWKSSFRACQSTISDQCDAAARIGCAMAASSKCRPPWWRNLVGPRRPDFEERERCEEREFESCFASAKEKCSDFAAEKCFRSFREARVSARLARDSGETTFMAIELTGWNSDIDCVFGQFSQDGKLKTSSP